MARALLVIGGIMHVLFALFHILLHWSVGSLAAVSVELAAMKATLLTLNVVWTLVLLVFAYLSIFRPKEMLSTGIGRALSLGISLTWLLRLVTGFVYGGEIGVGAIALSVIFALIALIYLIPFILPKEQLVGANYARG